MTTEQIKNAVEAFQKLKESGVYLCSYCEKKLYCKRTRNASFLWFHTTPNLDFCSDFKEAENAKTN